MGLWCRRRPAAEGFRQAMATKFVVSGTASAWRWKRFRQAVVTEFVIYGALGGTCPPRQAVWKLVAPSGTCPPPGDLYCYRFEF